MKTVITLDGRDDVGFKTGAELMLKIDDGYVCLEVLDSERVVESTIRVNMRELMKALQKLAL